jgi:hypothetical protein
MFWIKDKEAFVATEEFGQDLEHVEVLQRKFEEFQKDMASQVNKDFFFVLEFPNDSHRIPKKIAKKSQRILREFSDSLTKDLEDFELLLLKFEEIQKYIASQVNINNV